MYHSAAEERVLEREQISRFSARMNILLAPGSKREKKSKK
jgi:hypothetical protein